MEEARHPDPEAWWQQPSQAEAEVEATLKSSSQMTQRKSRMRICQSYWKMLTSQRKVNPSTSKSVGKEGEAQAQGTEGAQAPPEETPLDPTKTTAPHQPPLTLNQVQAQNPPRTPPRTQPKTPPRLQAR